MSNRSPLISTGASGGFISVALGAFAAHALKARLTPEMLQVFQTGVHYAALHSLALIGLGLHSAVAPLPRWLGWSFCTGILLFSGSLWMLALTGVKMLGAITPLGGLAFLAGWAGWAWTARNPHATKAKSA